MEILIPTNFKVGDKIRIAKFPMGMTHGDSHRVEEWYERKNVYL